MLGGGTHHIGDKVELEAVASSGYKFEAWYENGSMLANSEGKPKMSFTAEKDREVEARFVPTGDAERSRRAGRKRARFKKESLELEAGIFFMASDYLENKDTDTNATLEGAADEEAEKLVITATPVQDTLADSGVLIHAGFFRILPVLEMLRL